MATVFVYGTLTADDRADAVLDEYSVRGTATLVGLHRVDGEYPTLTPGGSTDGRLLRTSDLEALDAYEGVPAGLYVRVAVPLADGSGTVETYVGHPGRLDALADWPGAGSFQRRVRQYVRIAPVRLRPDGSPTDV